LATMPVLEMDSLAGAYKIGKLKKSWPFKQTVVGLARGGQAISGLAGGIDSTSLQGRLAYGIVFENLKWEDAMDTLYNYYAGVKDWVHAVKVVEALVLEHPTEADLYDRAANIYGQMGDNENAAFYFRRSYTIAPTFDKARTIFVLYLKLDRPEEALPFLDYAMRNNAGGHYNHELFWKSMRAPMEGAKPAGKLQAAIEKDFNSFDAFKTQFTDAGKNRFGSGWAWLVATADKKLVVTSTPNQDNPLMDISDVKGIPVLGLDVWEHAYYLKYQNRRPDYINAWWNVVNWDYIQARFESM